MYFATKLYTYFFGKFVGQDELGNCYYISNFSKSNKPKRWVIYKGINEASKVPASWHRWLHYVTDKLPSETSSKEKYNWQKSHMPNLTATSLSYHPKGEDKYKNTKSNQSYKAWTPN